MNCRAQVLGKRQCRIFVDVSRAVRASLGLSFVTFYFLFLLSFVDALFVCGSRNIIFYFMLRHVVRARIIHKSRILARGAGQRERSRSVQQTPRRNRTNVPDYMECN